jgi:hypothetical protein
MESVKFKLSIFLGGFAVVSLTIWLVRHYAKPLPDALALAPQQAVVKFNSDSYFESKALPAIREFIRRADLPISADFSADMVTHYKIVAENPQIPRCELSLGPRFGFDVWKNRVSIYNNKVENCEHRVHANKPQSRSLLEEMLSKTNLLTEQTALLRATQIFTNLGYMLSDFHPAIVEQAYYYDEYRRYPKLHVKTKVPKVVKNSELPKTIYSTSPQQIDASSSPFVPLPFFSVQWDWKDTGRRAWETNRPTVDMFISGATSNLINFSDHVLFWQLNEYRLR